MDFAELARIRGLGASGNFEGAADALRPLLFQAETEGRNDPELLREAGLISVGLRDFHGSMIYLDAALRAGDRDLNTLGMLADVAHHLKCPQVVIDHLGRCAHPVLGSRWARALATLYRFRDAETIISQIPDAQDDPIVGEVRTLIAVGRYAPDRLQIAEDAAARFPTIPMIWGQLAAARQSFGDTEGACRAYREALKLEPEYPAWHYNYALSLLCAGEYVAGFREYDWRMHTMVDRRLVSHLPMNPGGVALWRGETLKGKVLVLYAEGGIGDAILGLRFIEILREEGVSVRVIVPSALLQLCRRNWPGVRFDEKGDDAFFTGADYWVPTLSVPERIGMRFSSVPARDGYMKADASKRAVWEKTIRAACATAGKSRSMALVWHGRIEHDYERTRAYTAEEFARRVPPDTLPVIIQVDASEQELACFGSPGSGACLWVGPELKDFDDTAAVLMACDDALFCDTSTAHLAGALGFAATVLIRNRFIWQWKCREDGASAWYVSPRVVIEDDGRQEEIVYGRVSEKEPSVYVASGSSEKVTENP